MRKIWTFNLVACFSAMLLAALPASSLGGKPPKGDPPPPVTPPVAYDVTWLPSYDGVTPFVATDVNMFGTVVGYSIVGGDITVFEDWHALVFRSSGEIIELQTELAGLLDDGWLITSARQINNSGRIAGHGFDALGNRTIFVYDELPTPSLQWLEIPGTTTNRIVRDLTEGGMVLAALTVDGVDINLVWDPDSGTITNLHQVTNSLDFGGSAQGLNDAGIVVGGIGYGDAFYNDLSTSSLQSLPDLGKGGYAFDINNSEVIVGGVDGRVEYPARWVNGVLDVLTDKQGHAAKVNEDGQILGTLSTKTKGRNWVIRPFLFDPVDGFWEIDELVNPMNDPDAVDWFLVEDIRVTGIAEGFGQLYGPIIAQAAFETGTEHCLLTPVP